MGDHSTETSQSHQLQNCLDDEKYARDHFLVLAGVLNIPAMVYELAVTTVVDSLPTDIRQQFPGSKSATQSQRMETNTITYTN
jgi:hypothetical protein